MSLIIHNINMYMIKNMKKEEKKEMKPILKKVRFTE